MLRSGVFSGHEEPTIPIVPIAIYVFHRLSAAEAVRARISVSALRSHSVELHFCFTVVFEVTVCLLFVKPKKQKHNRSGCEGKCGSPWNSFSVWSHRASVCCFRRSFELDNVKQTSSCICKPLPSLSANFFLKKLLVVVVYNMQTRSREHGEILVPFGT